MDVNISRNSRYIQHRQDVYSRIDGAPRMLFPVADWVEDYELMLPCAVLSTFGFQVDIVAPGKRRGQFVMSCVRDFDRRGIFGGTEVVLANVLGANVSLGLPITDSDFIPYQGVVERLGHAVLLTQDYDSVEPGRYSGLFIAGGRAPEVLQNDSSILRIVEHFFEQNKPVAANCRGASVLAMAGVLRGRYCTGHPAIRAQCRSVGANWVDDPELTSSVVDGNLVTSPEWMAISVLARDFLNLLGATYTTPVLFAEMVQHQAD